MVYNLDDIMVTKRIQRRNENILKRHRGGMSYRAIGKMFKLSQTQIMNIVHALKGEAG